jgi:signal recognition particle subunit SRP19
MYERHTASGMVENVIWPVYLDAAKTRAEGRRVSTELAVEDPTVDEIAQAVQQVGYDAVIERSKTHPREYEPRGRVLVKEADDASKSDLLGATAAYLDVIRA